MANQPSGTLGCTARQIVESSAANGPSLIAGSGTITKSGNGDWSFSGSNTFTGATNVTGENNTVTGTIGQGGRQLHHQRHLCYRDFELNLNGQNQAIGSLGGAKHLHRRHGHRRGTLQIGGTSGPVTGTSFTMNGTATGSGAVTGTGALTKTGN